MTVSASIKFTQGILNPPAGQALFGAQGSLVVVSNGNDANVVRWVWTILDVPPGSAVTVGVVSDGPTASFSFTPDHVDSFFVQLDVYDLAGNKSTDRRVFAVQRQGSRYIPPFDAEAGELNFGGQTRGWAVAMEAWLGAVDGRWKASAKGRIYTFVDQRNTADATVTTAVSVTPNVDLELTVASGKSITVSVDAIVEGGSDDATDNARFTLLALFNVVNIMGTYTVTQVGATDSLNPKFSAGAAAWAATIDTDGTVIRVRLMGDGGPRQVNWLSVPQFTARAA
jgi:hypothetical protein